MPRRTKVVTITAEGRDKGKRFFITEMFADDAESWAMQALLALTNAGAEVPDVTQGMAGLAVAGFQSLQRLQFAAAKPLLDQMMTCVQYVPPDERIPAQPIGAGVNCKIEEVPTFITLRREVFRLHADFFTPDAAQKLASDLTSA